MPKLLSDRQIETYRRDGYCFPVRAMSAADAAGYRAKLEAFEASQGGSIKGAVKTKMHLVLTWIHEVVMNPTILDAVEDVLGPDILCWNSSFFIKEANDPGHVTWHQDSTYWGLSTPDVCSVWVALSPSTLESGAMRVIPGTHTSPQLEHEDTFDDHNLLTRGQKLKQDPDEGNAVDIVLQPGEISLHQLMLVHGSEPNRTDDRRIGLVIRYIAPTVSQKGGIPDSAMLVRGKDTYGNFEHERAPAADMHPDAVAHHAEIMKQHQALKYAGTDRGYR